MVKITETPENLLALKCRTDEAHNVQSVLRYVCHISFTLHNWAVFLTPAIQAPVIVNRSYKGSNTWVIFILILFSAMCEQRRAHTETYRCTKRPTSQCTNNWCVGPKPSKLWNVERGKDLHVSLLGLQWHTWYQTELKSAEKQKTTEGMKQDNV